MRHFFPVSILLTACLAVPTEGNGATEDATDTGGEGSTTTSATSAASGSTTGASSATDSGATTGATGTTGGVECPAAALGPGEHTRTLVHDGLERTYHLYLPGGHDGSAPWPLVMNFHPWTQTATYQAEQSGMREKADAEGFLVVHAQGISNSWNGGPECCDPAASDNVDDVGFVRAMVAEIETLACVDPSRVYSTGYSNGGFLSYRLACEAADLVAAVAPVVARMGLPAADCNPSRPVPLMAINGTADTLVSHDLSVASVELWAGLDGCVDEPMVSFQNGSAECLTRSRCDEAVEVTHCSLEGAGHCWFGQPTCFTGPNSTDLIATDAVWDFLKRWSL